MDAALRNWKRQAIRISDGLEKVKALPTPEVGSGILVLSKTVSWGNGLITALGKQQNVQLL